MTKDANIPVVMDATGNSLQRSSSRVHVYDEQGRLSQVLNPTALYADFLYNALGQRTLKRTYLTSGALDFTITHLYGADGQLLGQVRYNNLGKKTSALYWIWLEGMPLAEVEFKYNTGTGAVTSTSQYYLHSDHLNTPRLATNQAQTLLWKWDSDAFGLGNPIGDVDGDGVVVDIPLRFPGQIFEAYSNLNYNYFRDYDPSTGRYVQSDPIGLEGGLNTYGYVGGNPLSFSDVDGLFARPGARAGTSNSAMNPYFDPTVAPCLLCPVSSQYPPIGPEVPAPAKPGSTTCLRPAISDIEPKDFCEQLALAEAKAGAGVEKMWGLGDEPRLTAHYGPGPWVKMEHTHRCPDGRLLVIHYFSNRRGLNVELKFK